MVTITVELYGACAKALGQYELILPLDTDEAFKVIGAIRKAIDRHLEGEIPYSLFTGPQQLSSYLEAGNTLVDGDVVRAVPVVVGG
jgi:hypothetical protein